MKQNLSYDQTYQQKIELYHLPYFFNESSSFRQRYLVLLRLVVSYYPLYYIDSIHFYHDTTIDKHLSQHKIYQYVIETAYLSIILNAKAVVF